MESTPVSLLERLRRTPSDYDWDLFVNLFTPILRRWARGFGVPSQDADDLMQSVLIKVHRTMPGFEYDPTRSFRSWLRRVLRNHWLDLCKKQGKQCVGLPDSDIPDASDDSDEDDYRRELVGRCLRLIEPDFHPNTWKAVMESLQGNEPIKDVAARNGVTANALTKSRGRVLHRLRTELRGLIS